MDYSVCTNNTEDNQLWEWQEDNYYLQKDPHLDIPHSLWEEESNDRLSYMFDGTTPVKACGDLAYNISNSASENDKEVEEYKGYTSQIKRRRMLQFNTHDSLLCDENPQYDAFQNSKEDEALIEEVSPEDIQWAPGFFGGGSDSGNCSLDQSSQEWLSNCFNDGAMQLSSEDMNVSGISDDQIDISEFCNITDDMESEPAQTCPTPSPIKVYRGRKSYIRPPQNLASSVAYPFALIKPCGFHGDVTLKDINQRISSPNPSTLSQDKEENPSAAYPTSAFSGKPVVVKTKIRTEGGKGSITIMRTKG